MAVNPVDVQTGELLETLERKIFLLRQEYEQYFLGMLKKEPTDKKDEVESILRNLSRQRINNTALNFRYQQLKARFSTLSLYWLRTVKQIEEGTYKRDRFRLKLRVRDEEEMMRLDELRRLEEEEHRREEHRKAQSSQSATRRDTIADQTSLQQLYRDFITTRQRCQERVDNVQFDKMVEFMRQQTAQLKERYQCSSVRFEVVEDGGKAKLKAVPVR